LKVLGKVFFEKVIGDTECNRNLSLIPVPPLAWGWVVALSAGWDCIEYNKMYSAPV
jgi:hypothetical protein